VIGLSQAAAAAAIHPTVPAPRAGDIEAIQYLRATLVACSLTAWYAYRWVEMPLLRSLNRAPKAPTGLSPG